MRRGVSFLELLPPDGVARWPMDWRHRSFRVFYGVSVSELWHVVETLLFAVVGGRGLPWCRPEIGE